MKARAAAVFADSLLGLAASTHGQKIGDLLWNQNDTSHREPPIPFGPFLGYPLSSLTDTGTNAAPGVHCWLYDPDAGDSSLFGMFDGGGVDGPDGRGPLFGTNDFYFVIGLDTNVTGFADLTLFGPKAGLYYQWWSKLTLDPPNGFQAWTPGEVLYDSDGTNVLAFTPVPFTNAFESTKFFRATGGNALVRIEVSSAGQTPKEPCSTNDPGEIGQFLVELVSGELSYDLDVHYDIACGPFGSAINGVDYTNITNHVTIPAGQTSATITIQPLHDGHGLDWDEYVALKLLPTNDVVVDPFFATAALKISECVSNPFTVVATNVPEGNSIAYSATNHGLIIGANNFNNGEPNDFILLDTNGIQSQWSGVNGFGDETKHCTIKITTNGLHKDDVLFGTGAAGEIAWISADGTTIITNWITLPGETDPAKGAIYQDLTGTWSNCVLVVTGPSGGQLSGSRGVWLIDGNTNAHLITRIPTGHLEGLVTLSTNANLGPWNGKLVTADEPNSKIFAVDISGAYEVYDWGIEPDDIHIIPPSNHLYCVNDKANLYSWILRVSEDYFTNFVGGVLLEQAGEVNDAPTLFIVTWDSISGCFKLRSLDLNSYFSGKFEHVVFSPEDIPNLPISGP